MKTIYKGILEAMQAERPNDEIVEVLSNKFCIAHAHVERYINGKFQGYGFDEEKTVFGLHNGKVYTYFSPESILKNAKSIELYSNTYPIVSCKTVNKKDVYVCKIIDNRRKKAVHRKLVKLLSAKK